MERILAKIIDGSGSDKVALHSEPSFTTKDALKEIVAELIAREPLFHREEFGLTREVFEDMTEPSFWEVGASGKRYSREYVLETLENRYKNITRGIWYMDDFQCQEIAPDNYLVTYTLLQGKRQSRRCTIWRRAKNKWKIVYHQGTMVEP